MSDGLDEDATGTPIRDVRVAAVREAPGWLQDGSFGSVTVNQKAVGSGEPVSHHVAMTSRTRLVLVRHALPVFDRNTGSQDWSLSDQGRSDAETLASQLDLPADTHLVSSDELKARQTAEAFSNEIVIDRRLREASRPWVEQGDYEATARRWLEGERVDGWETQSDVVGRMIEAVNEAAPRGGNDVCLVSHGLAISVLVAHLAGVDPVEFWPRLRFPDYVRIKLWSSPLKLEHGGAEEPTS